MVIHLYGRAAVVGELFRVFFKKKEILFGKLKVISSMSKKAIPGIHAAAIRQEQGGRIPPLPPRSLRGEGWVLVHMKSTNNN